MCDPVSASLALGGVSTVLSTLSQYRAGESSKIQAETQARVQDRAAQDSRDRGESQKDALAIQTGQLLGSQRVAQAANGVELSSGSALEIREDTAVQSARDSLKIGQDAEIEALNLRTQAGINRQAASNISPGTAAATTFIGGASQFADRWYTYKGAG